FIRNLLVHLAEKILRLQPLKIGGDYQTACSPPRTAQARPGILYRTNAILYRIRLHERAAQGH
ncbi:hypothetical protein ACN2XU_24195, partial [Primorskyibacter sp. 2E107]|uniref:hypothetical protein n=1 Tax=Primorskyibacter sp. 2E107 TaxID=3403458 RepID=UPI003AF8A1BC